jgi:hypothetical protein
MNVFRCRCSQEKSVEKIDENQRIPSLIPSQGRHFFSMWMTGDRFQDKKNILVFPKDLRFLLLMLQVCEKIDQNIGFQEKRHFCRRKLVQNRSKL